MKKFSNGFIFTKLSLSTKISLIFDALRIQFISRIADSFSQLGSHFPGDTNFNF